MCVRHFSNSDSNSEIFNYLDKELMHKEKKKKMFFFSLCPLDRKNSSERLIVLSTFDDVKLNRTTSHPFWAITTWHENCSHSPVLKVLIKHQQIWEKHKKWKITKKMDGKLIMFRFRIWSTLQFTNDYFASFAFGFSNLFPMNQKKKTKKYFIDEMKKKKEKKKRKAYT